MAIWREGRAALRVLVREVAVVYMSEKEAVEEGTVAAGEEGVQLQSARRSGRGRKSLLVGNV